MSEFFANSLWVYIVVCINISFYQQTVRMHEYTQTHSDHEMLVILQWQTEREANNSVLITAVHTSMNNPNTVRVPGDMKRTGKRSSCNTHTHVHREKALRCGGREWLCVLLWEQPHCLKLAASTKVWHTCFSSQTHLIHKNMLTSKCNKQEKHICVFCLGGLSGLGGALGYFGGGVLLHYLL